MFEKEISNLDILNSQQKSNKFPPANPDLILRKKRVELTKVYWVRSGLWDPSDPADNPLLLVVHCYLGT